jgi:hypothetical protein
MRNTIVLLMLCAPLTTAADSKEKAPPETKGLKETAPVKCERNNNIKLSGVIIKTDTVAVTTEGNCNLTIENSKIISTKGAAIMTMGSTNVTLTNVEVEGKWGSVMNAGSANVTITGSKLRGRFAVEGSSHVKLSGSEVWGGKSVTPSAKFVDGGGNKFH